MVFFLVSSSHDDETFVKENRCFWGGGYRGISLLSVGSADPTALVLTRCGLAAPVTRRVPIDLEKQKKSRRLAASS